MLYKGWANTVSQSQYLWELSPINKRTNKILRSRNVLKDIQEMDLRPSLCEGKAIFKRTPKSSCVTYKCSIMFIGVYYYWFFFE
jgi:hypothetical protein